MALTEKEQRQIDALGLKTQGVNIYDSSGKLVGNVARGTNGITTTGQAVYMKSDGSWTADPLDVSSFSLTGDGAIKITAPKELTDLPEFKEIFNENTIKAYSAAYRTDNSYRVPYTQRKEDGTTEEVQITIPEFVEKLNEGLKDFVDNYKVAKKNQQKLVQKHGEKANNLSLTQLSAIQNTGADSSRVYLPDFIFNTSTPFDQLKDMRDEYGTVSKEDFQKYYNFSKVNQEDLAGIMAMIEGHLRGSDWGEEEIAYDDGTTVKNPNSASEATKALALKQYILSVDPNGEWYQEVGEGVVTLAANAADGFTTVLTNLVAFPLHIFGNDSVYDWNEQKQETFSTWNEERLLTQDSTALLATLGQIGGMVGGTVALNILGGAAAEGVSGAYSSALAAAGAEAGISGSVAASQALTISSLLNLENVSLGARLVLASAPIVSKVMWATNIYKTFMEGHKVLSFSTALLLDTIHDAILYNGTDLRHIMESTDDENVRNYWLSQFYDNAKWWIGMGIAKRGLSFVANTPVAMGLNARASQRINRILVWVGDKKQAIKDSIYGGDVVRALEEQVENAKPGIKRNRLIKKLEIAQENENLREARRAFAYADLDYDGFKLTEESAEKYKNAQDAIRQIENSIDHYNQNTLYKQMEMVGLTRDPSTGQMIYVNPDLGRANATATKTWEKLQELTTRYNLPVDKTTHGTIGQDIIDYLVGSQDLKIKSAIANAGGEHALAAASDVEVIKDNLQALVSKLPTEVISYLNAPTTLKSYTDFYYELNRYGMSKGLVDVDTISSYESNPIWRDNGYMPIEKIGDTTGTRWVPENGRYDALIQDDMEHFTYITKPGQHYNDPELVRQKRLNAMAKTEINSELYKAYRAVEDATNTVVVTGKETARAATIKGKQKSLQNAIETSSKGVSDNVFMTAAPAKSKKPVENLIFSEAETSEALASFSLSETTQVLREKHVLSGGYSKLSEMVTAENYDAWYKAQSAPVQRYLINYYDPPIMQLGRESAFNNYGLFRKALEQGGDDFEAGLQRAYLAGDSNFRKSSLLNQAIDNITSNKAPFEGGYDVATAKGYLRNIKGLDVERFVDDAQTNVKEAVDDYVANVLDDKGAKQAIDALADNSNGAALSGKMVALQELKNNKEAKEAFVDSVVAPTRLVNDSVTDQETLKRQVGRLWDNYISNELNTTRNALKTVAPELVDTDALYEEVKALNEKITGAKANENTIMFLDDKGRQCYAEVDPNFASLYKYRYQMTPTDAMAMAKANAAMSRLFRFGTTTLNLSSFGNQAFRDTGNALMVGGAWRTIKSSADNMVNVFGEDIVEQIKRFDPTGYEMRQVESIAEQTGQSLKEAAVSRELARGAAISPASTETVLYREFMRQAYKSPDGMLDNMEQSLNDLISKYSLDDLMNGKRENYLRNRVYANNYNSALEQGYTIGQARTFAEFAMNNATTNFSRQLYHMQAIADSTPYFRSAINGAKSFWRMWSLDPVGISGRIMGGLVLPSMYLVGASLGDEDNREVYKNIPEYQKAESLVFVVNKQPVSIPIPQEIANIVAPVRQFVEYLYGTNESDFWELMMNDVLGFSPIDLTAYTTIDMDKMIEDPTLVDRISRGTARVFSQMAPVPIKTMYMLATGTDPYTGKKLTDPTYTYWDNQTESLQTMDYNQSAFAKTVAKVFGEDANATLIEKVVSGVVGSTGSNILGQIGAVFNEGLVSGLSQIGQDVVSQVVSPYDVSAYNQVDAVWKRAVKELEAEKNAITSSKKWNTIYSQLSQTTDPEERKKLIAEGQSLVAEYQQKIATTVERLNSVYGGQLDRKKFGAVINLLNFNSDPIYQTGTQYSSNIATDSFYEGRDMAISTMEALGVTGTSDLSIFGYLTTDSNGNTVMKYSSPTAIIESSNIWYGAADIDQANIEAKLKADGIKTSDMWDGYYKAKAQGKTALKQFKSEWNAKVVRSLAPYVSERGVDAVLKNSKTRELLDDYILIDNPYQTKQYLTKIFGGN